MILRGLRTISLACAVGVLVLGGAREVSATEILGPQIDFEAVGLDMEFLGYDADGVPLFDVESLVAISLLDGAFGVEIPFNEQLFVNGELAAEISEHKLFYRDKCTSNPPNCDTDTCKIEVTHGEDGKSKTLTCIELFGGCVCHKDGVVKGLGWKMERVPIPRDAICRLVVDPANEVVELDEKNNTFETTDHSIPTVSEWGVVVMVLVLLVAGTIVFAGVRRRRTAAA